jgi:hypothetical protein
MERAFDSIFGKKPCQFVERRELGRELCLEVEPDIGTISGENLIIFTTNECFKFQNVQWDVKCDDANVVR